VNTTNTIRLIKYDFGTSTRTNTEMHVDPKFIDTLYRVPTRSTSQANTQRTVIDELSDGGAYAWDSGMSIVGIGYDVKYIIQQMLDLAQQSLSQDEIDEIKEAFKPGLSDDDKSQLRKDAGLD